MKKFQFNLQPVLSLRRQTQRLKQKEFADVVQEIRRCERDIMCVLSEREAAQKGLRLAQQRRIEPWQVVFHLKFLNHLDGRLSRLREELLALSRKAEKKRLELVEASKKKKSLEKLRERRKVEYEYEAGREERKMFDEVGGIYKQRARQG